MSAKFKGTVKWFNDTKGYGFITRDDGGDDLFVHQSSILADGWFRSLAKGESVEFAVSSGDDGRTKAVDVTGPGGVAVQGSSRGGGRGGGVGPVHSSGPRKAPPIEQTLPCSLEDLYKGTTKKMKISRERTDISGKTIPVEEILTINIKPGWKKGTKITFPDKGNEQPNITPSDLVFIVDEKPHTVFTRDGNDLVTTQKISLADALTGYTVHLTTLDGRNLTIPINNVINPNYEEVVPREGMPVPKDPTRKGDLRINFNIKFPTRLTPDQKAGIKKPDYIFPCTVLSDPQKKAVYDQYGEEGLKGVPPPDAGGTDASYFSTGGGPTTFKFNPRNADDIFAEFFGSSSPFGGIDGSMRGGASQFGGMFGDNMFASFGEGGGVGPMHSSGPRKAPPIEQRLPCSLEDLYKGITKKMKISRERTDISGKTIPLEEILTINIKPGWKKGTKITFPDKGNEQPNITPSDLVFIVDEKPHTVFTRDGNDLVTTQKISLADALTGYTVHLTTLDGRNLTIPINNVINPNYEEVVPREGMPVPKDPTRKGDLRIKFNIKFPTRLTSDQKAGNKKLLAF